MTVFLSIKKGMGNLLWSLLHRDHSLLQFSMFYPGRYFVRYPDGMRSVYMQRKMARSYAKVFKGTVHHEREKPMPGEEWMHLPQ